MSILNSVEAQSRKYMVLLGLVLVLVVGIWFGNRKSASEGRRLLKASQVDTTSFGEEYLDDVVNEEEEEEGSEDFLNVTVVVVIVLLLLALTIAFEHTKEHLEEVCSKAGRHMTLILEKLFGEMTVLGFLSVATFCVTQAGFFRAISESLFDEQGELLELFELVHFSIFFVMIFFVLQVFVLVKGAIRTEHKWIHMDRTARERRAGEGSMNTNSPHHTTHDDDDAKEQQLFEALREEFIRERDVEPPFDPTPESHRVTHDFPFGRYLSICLGNLLTHTVEVNSWTWIFFAGATIVYYVVCLLVEEDVKVLVWTWVGMAWAVFLFNIVFERHLNKLRSAFAAKHDAAHSETEPESTQLLSSDSSLPSWCNVDLDSYLQSRSWLTRHFVGGTPNRQQALFWMERKGPSFYLFILQINLIFVGLYSAVQLLEFLAVMRKEPLYLFVIYLVLATLPVLGIMLNKQELVATLSQVCCLGVYRRPQAVTTVLREEKTVHVVRSFIILYKLRQMVERAESHGTTSPRRSSSRSFGHLETAEISKTFDAYDHSGDGFITYDEFRLLLSKLGASMDDESIRKVIEHLDTDNSGCVSKAEFLQWYAEQEGHEDEISERERAEFLFEMFDENGTGQVTIGEFKQKLDALHAGLTVDDVGAIVNELDQDNNGRIGLEEFEHLIEKYYPRELSE